MCESKSPVKPELGSLPFGFSIVGAQKSGTTTLSRMLDQHRHICRAPHKEMEFFNDECQSWADPDYSNYRAPKQRSSQRIAGDATPAYLFWPGALERMHAYNPRMSLIAVLRDPIDRLFSHWCMQRRRYDHKAPDWPEMIEFRPSSLPRQIPGNMTAKQFRRLSGVIRGCYGSQLRHGMEIFDRSQWLLLDFESFLGDHERHLDEITDFLGIQRFRQHPTLLHHHGRRRSVVGTAPTTADISSLAEYYAQGLEQVADLSGLDVSGWTTSRILTGELSAKTVAAAYALKAGLT